MRTRGRCRWLALLSSLLAVGIVVAVRAQDSANENRVKAAFLYQFPQFVEWPARVWRESGPVRLCVATSQAMADELSRLVDGEDLNDRKFEVVEVTGGTSVAGCHLLFVRAGAAGRPLLRAATGRPILTISDDVQGLELGAVIAFRVVERRVRFEINTENARRNGVRISSQLLGLALAVRGGE
jgi:hypothetical protein